jgi:hypothetical protein
MALKVFTYVHIPWYLYPVSKSFDTGYTLIHFQPLGCPVAPLGIYPPISKNPFIIIGEFSQLLNFDERNYTVYSLLPNLSLWWVYKIHRGGSSGCSLAFYEVTYLNLSIPLLLNIWHISSLEQWWVKLLGTFLFLTSGGFSHVVLLVTHPHMEYEKSRSLNPFPVAVTEYLRLGHLFFSTFRIFI